MLACGPLFSNRLLTQGTSALFTAPLSILTQSLSQIIVTTPVPKAAPPKSTRIDQTSTASLIDLKAALGGSSLDISVQNRIYQAFERERNKITQYLTEKQTWKQQQRWRPELSSPVFQPIHPVKDLPIEFQAYLAGAAAYHNEEPAIASEHWNRLLRLQPEERQYRSTWATFMLGKLALVSDPTKAIELFHRTRTLVENGFEDSLGLASSSLGWEAKIYLNQHNFERALELYLEQHIGGDPSAAASIKIVIKSLFKQTDPPLDSIAINPRTRRVIGSYLLSRHFSAESETSQAILSRWNQLLERNRITDSALAEAMVLSLYRLGQYKEARRWTTRTSPDSLMSRWILAKLELRDGQTERAIEIYSSLIRHLPTGNEQDKMPGFYVDRGEYGLFRSPAQNQIRGENSLIQLSQQDFVQALHSMMQSGSWLDAAYIAERVLKINELKEYVDQHWPANEKEEPPLYGAYSHELSKESLREKIRSLLGRRLLRSHRWQECVPYFVARYQHQAQRVGSSIDFGHQENRSKKKRADALWTAAFILRYDGLALIATEAEPDWSLYGANFQRSPISETRFDRKRWPELKPSLKERQRVEETSLAQPKRFHYRYAAANLAWEASTLMPDEDPETARILCQAGSWLKIIDPQAADRFYHALVSRCGQTLLGKKATELGWFPRISKNGELIQSDN